MSGADPNAKIWKLMSEVGVAMVVTHADRENMRARPMVARVESDDNAVYFFTDADAPKDQEIAHDSHVCLVFADPKSTRFVSVTGVAEAFADVGLAERLWRASADKAYFSDPTDPRLRVIRVTPDSGEFWEGAGMISTLVSLLKAGARHERPKLGENEKVAM